MLKVTSFYGQNVARPHLLLDKDGETVKDRVDAMGVNDALVHWASKVPFKKGGLLLKPTWEGDAPVNARTDFQIFMEERTADVIAANPHLVGDPNRQALWAAGSGFWSTQLTEYERKEYRTRAKDEREVHTARVAELEEEDESYKAFRAKDSLYKKAVTAINTATRAASGPLWRLQRLVTGSAKAAAREADAKGTTASRGSRVTRKTGLKRKGRKKTHAGLPNAIQKRPTKKLGVRSKQFKAKLAQRQAVVSPAAELQQEGQGSEKRATRQAAAAGKGINPAPGSKKTRSKANK